MRKAPNFTLPDQHGTLRSLADFAGRWVVVYFYPKDNTPACTAQACSFRDTADDFIALDNALVIGISKDSVRKHARFVDDHQLNFLLLSDPEHTTIEAYGAWAPKKFMGREFMGTHRNTYVIDPAGMIVKCYEDVKAKDHATLIASDLRILQHQYNTRHQER